MRKSSYLVRAWLEQKITTNTIIMSVIHTCSDALKKLKKGNAEHAHKIEQQGNREPYKVGFTEDEQRPYAAILSCADSRVIPECIFTAKAGELFVVRVAGNIANTSSIASLEYAVQFLHVRVIVVLGHEACGAVDAAITQATDRTNPGRNLNSLLSHIIPAVNGRPPEESFTNNLETATKRNANVSADELLEQSEILKKYHAEEGLNIFHGYYQVYGKDAGKVKDIDTWSCS